MINTDYFWRIVVFLAIGTFSIRASIILISSKIRITDELKQIFSFIPAAIIPALVAPMVFYHKGQVSWVFGKERFVILLLATIVCYFSRSMMVTIFFGLSTLYLVTQL